MHFKNSLARWSILVVGLLIVGWTSLGQAQERRRWDPKAYLERLDRNGNGVLETSEMSDRTVNFARGLGFDTSQPIRIKSIVDKIDRDREEKATEERKSSSPTKVPGFGVTVEREGVNDFSASVGSNRPADLRQQYGDEVMSQVSEVLQRYDQNRNGQLDVDEIRKGRWGSPSPQESDTNRDGILSKSELAARYAARNRQWNQESNRRRESESNEKSDSSLKFRSGSSFATRAKRSVSSGGTRTSDSTSTSTDTRYKKYAEGLIKNYDKNGDNKLDSQELKNMRRPPKGADIDKDGFITTDELANSLSGKTTVSSNSPSKSESSKSSRDSSVRSTSSVSIPSSMADLDANGDGQIQMHEFSSEWNGDVLTKFLNRDMNRDGVITAKEWEATRD